MENEELTYYLVHVEASNKSGGLLHFAGMYDFDAKSARSAQAMARQRLKVKIIMSGNNPKEYKFRILSCKTMDQLESDYDKWKKGQ